VSTLIAGILIGFTLAIVAAMLAIYALERHIDKGDK